MHKFSKQSRECDKMERSFNIFHLGRDRASTAHHSSFSKPTFLVESHMLPSHCNWETPPHLTTKQITTPAFSWAPLPAHYHKHHFPPHPQSHLLALCRTQSPARSTPRLVSLLWVHCRRQHIFNLSDFSWIHQRPAGDMSVEHENECVTLSERCFSIKRWAKVMLKLYLLFGCILKP